MSFISKETLLNMRKKRGVEFDLSPYVGIEQKVLVRPIPFADSVPLTGLGTAMTADRTTVIIKALGAAVLDPSTMEPIGEESLRQLFNELGLEEGMDLLSKLQERAFPKVNPGN